MIIIAVIILNTVLITSVYVVKYSYICLVEQMNHLLYFIFIPPLCFKMCLQSV